MYFLPNCSPGEDFAKNIESAFWQGEQIKTKLANYWQIWEKIGKNIFVMALIMGIQRGNIVWPLGWASSPSRPVWLVSVDKDGGMGVWGGA